MCQEEKRSEAGHYIEQISAHGQRRFWPFLGGCPRVAGRMRTSLFEWEDMVLLVLGETTCSGRNVETKPLD